MAGYAAAKKAAQSRGIKTTQVEARRAPLISVGLAVKAVLLIVVVGGLSWGVFTLFKPKPPRYLQFPATGQESARQFLTHISAGEDKEYDQAYGLIADAVRDPQMNDEIGHYRQMFHNMNRYLSNEFGANWIQNTQVAADPADPNVMIARVSLETLHIRVANQTPPDRKGAGPHYGILSIDEFNINDSSKMLQTSGLEGGLRMLGADGAIPQLDLIRGASGEPNNETPMQKKLRLLPVVGDPRTVSWKAIVQLWKIRTDPVVRARLEAIMNDGRYDPVIQKKAEEVLKEKTTEEDRVAAGVRE
jgi:hypothetical protein